MIITQTGHINDGTTVPALLYTLAQDVARLKVGAITPLVDSSTGSTTGLLAKATVAGLANSAASGSNLAQKASTETQLNAIKDALQEIADRTITLHAQLGMGALTYSGGGTTADGTVGAISSTITGATTGVTLANITPIVNTYNRAVFFLSTNVNKVVKAVGGTPFVLTNFNGDIYTSPSALATSTGTAADPALTAAQIGVIIDVYQDNVAKLAAKLNTVTTSANLRVTAG